MGSGTKNRAATALRNYRVAELKRLASEATHWQPLPETPES